MAVSANRGSVDAVPVLIATCIASSIGALIFNTMPVLLGVIAETKGHEDSVLSMLSSQILLGALTGVVVAMGWIDRLPWRPVMALSALLAIGVSLLIPIAGTAGQLGWVLGVMGFLMGSLYAPALAALGGAADPVRAFGVALILQVSVSAAVAFALPSFLAPSLGAWSISAVMAVTCVVVILTYPILPRRQIGEPTPQADRPDPPSPAAALTAGFFALAAMMVFYFGIMGVWQFLERFGVSKGLGHGFVGGVIAIALLVGAAGAVLPAVIGARFGLVKPFMLAVSVLAGSIFCFLAPHSALSFAAGVILLNAGWNTANPFMYTVVAESDPSGRLIVATVIVQMIGATLGAVAAGQILIQSGFSGVFAFFAACLGVTLGLHLLSVRILRRAALREAAI